jgi:hypothetical protein
VQNLVRQHKGNDGKYIKLKTIGILLIILAFFTLPKKLLRSFDSQAISSLEFIEDTLFGMKISFEAVWKVIEILCSNEDMCEEKIF